ncbi:MAG TPA: hypothetical protein VM053_01805 [Gemmatimonadaceae bacterium]|nr:hypothetical protein [Gemmatimonadaceae bacterium]
MALVAPRNEAPSWKMTVGLGVAVAVFFRLVGDSSQLPWLLVVLSLIYVAFLLRREALDMRHARSKDQALREALFAFGFTSLLMFSIGHFSKPDDSYAPLRMALTMGVAWGVVAYRVSRGYPQGAWRMLATLLAVAVPITVLWVAGQKIIGG